MAEIYSCLGSFTSSSLCTVSFLHETLLKPIFLVTSTHLCVGFSSVCSPLHVLFNVVGFCSGNSDNDHLRLGCGLYTITIFTSQTYTTLIFFCIITNYYWLFMLGHLAQLLTLR